MTPKTYTTAQVARITGATQRQLQWWDEQGVVTVLMLGHQRQYAMADLFDVSLVCDLRARGLSVQKIRVVQKAMRKKSFPAPDGSHKWMLTDGKRVELIADQAGVMAFLEQRRPPFVLVPLADIAARLALAAPRALAGMPARREMGRATAPVSEASREAKRA